MERRSRTDLAIVAALAAGLLAFFVSTFLVYGYRLPVGPDAPVYLWWVRLAAHEGLSAVGHRPGIPALALTLGGTLHLTPVAVLAGLECALGAGVGLAAAALVRGRGDASTRSPAPRETNGRAAWVLAGVLAGTFAVHVATGYLANLAFAALFLGAAAALTGATRAGVLAAAALLGAGGLAHPLFFLLGLAILALAGLMAWRSGERGEAARVAGAAGGGALVAGAGLLALLAGSDLPAVDTSKDAFLRRAGLTGELREAYLDRFVRHWARYVQWVSIPLALVGLGLATGARGRLLRAWAVVAIAGMIGALATGWAPPDRFVAFGYVVPILAAFGLVRVWRRLAPHRATALAATGALLVAMLLGAAFTWRRQEPFMTPAEVSAVTHAGRFIAPAPAGTPLVFLVETGDASISFFATQAANAIRASVPPGRIRDVYVMVPPREGNSPDRRALSTLYRRDAAAAVRRAGGRVLRFVLRPFYRGAPLPEGLMPAGPDVLVAGTPAASTEPLEDPLVPSSPVAIALAAGTVLAALALIGSGWSLIAVGGVGAVALSPAFGAAGVIVAGIALERVGLPLSGSVGPTLVSVLVGGGGHAIRFVLQRRARTDPAPHI